MRLKGVDAGLARALQNMLAPPALIGAAIEGDPLWRANHSRRNLISPFLCSSLYPSPVVAIHFMATYNRWAGIRAKPRAIEDMTSCLRKRNKLYLAILGGIRV
jgi:hypothetical protein